LGWITRQHLRREWFFEQRDGSCRLMASFAVRLSESSSTWKSAVAPVAEMVCQDLWTTVQKPARKMLLPTRLTQAHRREAKGIRTVPVTVPPRHPQLCRSCGVNVTAGSRYCPSCAVAISTAELVKGAQKGRDASHNSEAQESRAEKGRRHTAARWAWKPSNQPAWLNEQSYHEKIQPLLAGVTVRALASALGVSIPYASNIRSGKRHPHPRHWLTLARLVGIDSSEAHRRKFRLI